MATYIFGEGPTGDQSGNHKNTFLGASLREFSFATNTSMGAGRLGTGDEQVPLLRFDYSSLMGETASSAILRLTNKSSTSGADLVKVHRLLTPYGVDDTDGGVTENPATGLQATFDNAKDANGGVGEVGWAAGLDAGFGAGDWDATEIASDNIALGEAIGITHDFDITTFENLVLAGSLIDNGIVIRQPGAWNWQIASQTHATPEYRPMLTVVTSGGGGATATRIQRKSGFRALHVGNRI